MPYGMIKETWQQGGTTPNICKIFHTNNGETSESRINTESFSHASGSVPINFKVLLGNLNLFPRKWECS